MGDRPENAAPPGPPGTGTQHHQPVPQRPLPHQESPLRPGRQHRPDLNPRRQLPGLHHPGPPVPRHHRGQTRWHHPRAPHPQPRVPDGVPAHRQPGTRNTGAEGDPGRRRRRHPEPRRSLTTTGAPQSRAALHNLRPRPPDGRRAHPPAPRRQGGIRVARPGPATDDRPTPPGGPRRASPARGPQHQRLPGPETRRRHQHHHHAHPQRRCGLRLLPRPGRLPGPPPTELRPPGPSPR